MKKIITIILSVCVVILFGISTYIYVKNQTRTKEIIINDVFNTIDDYEKLNSKVKELSNNEELYLTQFSHSITIENDARVTHAQVKLQTQSLKNYDISHFSSSKIVYSTDTQAKYTPITLLKYLERCNIISHYFNCKMEISTTFWFDISIPLGYSNEQYCLSNNKIEKLTEDIEGDILEFDIDIEKSETKHIYYVF